jgi:hypothetical protein
VIFYLTFGVQYAHEEHPVFPPAHPDGWISIHACCYRHAREAAFFTFGIHWCELLSEPMFPPELFPRGEIASVTIRPLVSYTRP